MGRAKMERVERFFAVCFEKKERTLGQRSFLRKEICKRVGKGLKKSEESAIIGRV